MLFQGVFVSRNGESIEQAGSGRCRVVHGHAVVGDGLVAERGQFQGGFRGIEVRVLATAGEGDEEGDQGGGDEVRVHGVLSLGFRDLLENEVV